jgi:hypothetical protein
MKMLKKSHPTGLKSCGELAGAIDAKLTKSTTRFTDGKNNENSLH